MIGTKLAHYEITMHIGSGGMGDVYQATDTKLGRSVAIKFLPEAFSHDAERVARFQREARVLASLNHPNIAAIYGAEETNSRHFLVMELVGGETLAERIRRGPIGVEEALTIARHIAEGLEEAHEKGVVHRDLKPANVKVTPEGKVKVLDFGLAKALETTAATSNLSDSPTLSMAATTPGIILGTAAYMSPEQAKGRPVDRRTDIFAFGCVLYEMLTGQAVFAGEDVPEILSRVLQHEPDWALLPENVPPRICELLRRCLDKNPSRRRRDAGDVRIDIEEAIASSETELASGTFKAARPLWRRALPWMITGVLALSLATVLTLSKRTVSERLSASRLNADLGADVVLATTRGAAAILSPDGTLLAFIGRKVSGGGAPGITGVQLYVRPLEQLRARTLSGTEGAQSPFFSPDGKWIGFFAGGKLKKISISGDSAISLADVQNERGGWWGDDGSIVYSPSGGPLFRVSSAGGTPEQVTKLEKLDNDQIERTHRWPQVLPGGKTVLFTSNTVTGNYESASIMVESLVTRERKILQRGGYYGRYLPSGHLLYANFGTLYVAPFDLDKLKLTGQSVPVIDGVTTISSDGNSQFAFSSDGKAVYSVGTDIGGPFLWWTDQNRNLSLMSDNPGIFNTRFSPDGLKVAVDIAGKQQHDIWVYDTERAAMSRFSSDADNSYPVWAPDGQRITFSSSRAGTPNVFWQRADGSTAEAQRLSDSRNVQIPTSWHPSGKFLAFSETFAQTGSDIMILPIEGNENAGWKPGKPFPFQASSDQESAAIFSPDGHWLAYQSNETGRDEIYVRPFPGPGGKWQVSTNGGIAAAWSQNKKELFYREGPRIMSTGYSAERDSFHADKPKLWVDGITSYRGGNLDPHPDGQRFAVLVTPRNQASTAPDRVVFVYNFFDELRRLAPPR